MQYIRAEAVKKKNRTSSSEFFSNNFIDLKIQLIVFSFPVNLPKIFLSFFFLGRGGGGRAASYAYGSVLVCRASSVNF